MYAVIEQGGKQLKVSQGDVVRIELTEVPEDATRIELDKVLFVSDGNEVKVGTPYLDGSRVIALFEKTAADALIKAPKVHGAHFRRRKNSKTRMGHRQKYLQVIIDAIEA
jgi:large subunit ribosomal protein L21